jgi:transposase
MSEREVRRAGAFQRVKNQDLKLVEAAEVLGLSYRQAKRQYRRYRQGGSQALVHGNAGKASNQAKPAKIRRRALALVQKHYGGKPGERFGPTLAAEHLAEDHQVSVDAETLRRWMLQAGLWTRERKRKPFRQRRERRRHFGELVQMDGSFAYWLEGRGPQGCLLHMVDDATSTSLATFAAEETTWGVADTLRAWVQEYGIPRALYVDWKTVYHSQPTARQRQEGIVPVSQFGGMCAKLGIALIGAHSPQAKGRVERGHGTHPDRLMQEDAVEEDR